MPSVGATVAVGAGAAGVSLLATPAMARLATRLGWTDRPGPLKPQSSATPYLGGAAVGLGVAVGALADRPLLLVPLLMALALGTLDDVRPLPPSVRLGGEAVTAGVVAALVATRFPDVVSFILVIAATIVLINGFNLIDGLDGLCGSVTLVGAVGFAVVLSGNGIFVAVALAGGVAAFLVFNRPPAQIYLGDGGSYLIGTCVAVLMALSWGPTQSLPIGVASLLLAALPAAELTFAIVRRARAGTALMAGDRDHPYDQMVRRGWGVPATVLAYAAASILLVVAAVVASRVGTGPALAILSICALALLALGFEAGFMSPGHRQTDNRQG